MIATQYVWVLDRLLYAFPNCIYFGRNMQMEESVLFSLKPNVMLIDYHM